MSPLFSGVDNQPCRPLPSTPKARRPARTAKTRAVLETKGVLLHRDRTVATVSGQTPVHHPKMHPPK